MITACALTASGQTNSGLNDWVTSLLTDSSGNFYAGTYSNGDGIFLSKDAGSSWQRTKMAYGVTSMILTKSGTLITFAYGQSFGRYLFRMTGAGSELDSVILDFTPTAMMASPSGVVYATTFGQGIYKSTDEGVHWEQLGGDTAPVLFASGLVITNGEIILVPTRDGVYRSSDNGASWTRGHFGFHDSLTVRQIIPSQDGKLYAGAFESMGINANELYVSSDTGKNWILISTFKFGLDVMAADSTGDVFAGNSDGVYRIAPNGDTSHLGLGGIAVNTWGVRSLLILGRDTILAGAWGGVYKTTNGGTTWQLLHDGMVSDTSNGNFTSPLPFGYFISSGVIDTHGTLIVGTDSGGVYRSVDGGKTWLQSDLTIPSITSVVLDSLGGVWAASLNNGVFKSTDGGASWATTENMGIVQSGEQCYTLAAYVVRLPRYGTDSTHMIRSDLMLEGNGWGVYQCIINSITPIWSPTGYISVSVQAMASLSTEVFASTIGSDVYVMHGAFSGWNYQGRVEEKVAAMAVTGSGQLFAVGPGGVYRSTDEGVNWTAKNFGLLDSNLVSAAVDAAGNVFVGSSQTGDIYKSSDGGNSWTRYATLAYPVRFLLVGQNGGSIYAAAAGRLFHNDIKLTGVIRATGPSLEDYSLSQNFPNPFNPLTTIRFGIPTRSRVHLTIYNLLGQRVAELVNEEIGAGYGERSWNANVSSGLYFYRLEAVAVSDPNKRFVDVKKMMLLK